MPVIHHPGVIDPLALHHRNPGRYPMLLESAAFESLRGRYDLLLAFPQQGLRATQDGRVETLDGTPCEGTFAACLDAVWQQTGEAMSCETSSSLPFVGGWGLFLTYEYANQIEARLDLPAPPEAIPVALALRCPAAVIIDRQTQETWLVAEAGHEALLDLLQQDVAELQDSPLMLGAVTVLQVQEAPGEAFVHGVTQAREYIAAGEVFQLNLSRQWCVDIAPDTTPASLYAALRRANPAPFAGLLAWDDWAIVSSSPERLVSVQGDRIETRPIAGTRPRLPDEDDADRIRELIGHPKERAEHVMLIDLERNDLGKLCTPGSVEVDELMVVESYTHVHHIVSNVRGQLRPNTTPGQIIHAVFPGGSITGCPKVRCMQLIARLEQEGRGAYTGAMGYLGHDGRMDLNILIRSLTVQDGRVRFRAGAGIVADSIPEAELAETRAKARGLLRALGLSG